MSKLKILGIVCIAFGIIDFASYYALNVERTGVSWSPYVAGAVGGFLLAKARNAPVLPKAKTEAQAPVA